MSLRNKRILITAGPTWVPIDKVRVISNLATGQTGCLLAKEAGKKNARVTLFLGPSETLVKAKRIKIVRFRYFDEFRRLLKSELKKNKFDIIIHSAAVSDFRPKKTYQGKISSDNKVLGLVLMPAPKIIRDLRKLNPKAFLVMFKLEVCSDINILISKAAKSRRQSGANLVVANSIAPYRAFIINEHSSIVSAKSKKELAGKLIGVLSKL